MAQNQKKYDTEYRIQAIKHLKEIGTVNAAAEPAIPVNTIYGWQKAVREEGPDTVTMEKQKRLQHNIFMSVIRKVL